MPCDDPWECSKGEVHHYVVHCTQSVDVIKTLPSFTLTISTLLEVVEGPFVEAEVESDQIEIFLDAAASAPLEYDLDHRRD